MILSMTGYGKGSADNGERKINVEIKSLNSKQFDMMMRLPSEMRESELDIRKKLADRLIRGKVETVITKEIHEPTANMHLDMAVIAGYKKQIEELAALCDLPEPTDWYATLLRLPDALKPGVIDYDQQDRDMLYEAVEKAAEVLTSYRIAEGRKLYVFFKEKIDKLFSLLSEVENYESLRVRSIEQRLRDQLERLDSIGYDRSRLEQELIYYIEKLDVAEEKTRLRAHLNYFLETMGGEDDLDEKGNGKKLGFIAQEMGREINTLGSKSNNAEMQKIVVRMKDELEQIKEQVLNVL